MSKKNRQPPSPRGDLNVPTTELTAQPPAEPNAPTQDLTMPAQEDGIDQAFEATMEAASPEKTEQPSGPTAKEMAAAEEANLARVQGIIARQQQIAQQRMLDEERPTLIEVAAQGMDALHEAIHAASNVPVPEYVPPPRTERQMTQLEQELEAGRKAVERNAKQATLNQEARAKQAAEERAKEGFTTPVYRPEDMVPDPMTGKMGQISS